MTTENKALNVPPLRFPEFADNWQNHPLSDIASFAKGKGIPKDCLTEIGHECILYGEMYTHFSDNTLIYSPLLKTQVNINCLVLSRKMDVILPASGETHEDISNACCVLKNDVLFGGDINIIRLRNEEDFHGDFLAYQLRSSKQRKFIARIAQGDSVVHLQNSQIKKINIAFPSSNEQTKIVALLSIIEKRIETQKKIIEDLFLLKSWLYKLTMDGASIRSVFHLGDLCSIKKGEQINGSELSSYGVYYYQNGGITHSGYCQQWNTEAGTITISEGGNSCGFVKLNKTRFWNGGHCYSLNINKESRINNAYLYHVLKAHERQIMRLRVGTGLPNIQRKDLVNFQVRLPIESIQENHSMLYNAIDQLVDCNSALLVSFSKAKIFFLSTLFI